MTDTLIERMASDLGITAYEEESEREFTYRVSYSAMSSWMKTIAMDKPVGTRESDIFGVSRRHMYERSRAVLDMLCKTIPELEEWYKVEEKEEHPVQLIRTRLLNHGDLLNTGFETNISLSKRRTEYLADHTKAVYGGILEEGLHYNGLAAVNLNVDAHEMDAPMAAVDWIKDFIKDAWWSTSIPDTSHWQYYNPKRRTMNLYSAWQDDTPEMTNGIILGRIPVNVHSYEYYLLKPTEKLLHRLDPFLQEQREHVRIMYALKAICRNPIEANIKRYPDHYILRLNARLPLQEEIILESYCWPVKHVTDELNWIMNGYIWEYLSPFIEALGINILEETDG